MSVTPSSRDPSRIRWSHVVLIAGSIIVAAIVAVILFRAGTLSRVGGHQGESRRLAEIRARGALTCGVWPEVAGFSQKDAAGRYSGFDVDMCRALAAAIFGTPDKIRFVEAATMEQFDDSSDVDVVSRRITWELQREGARGYLFGPITYFDGQTFLVPKRLGVTRFAQLAGKSICVQPVSHSEVALELYFRASALSFQKVPLDTSEDLSTAFRTTRCDAYTADASMLGSLRSRMSDANDFDILGGFITKEPLAQMVRQGDDRFFDVLRWTMFALIQAEELGVNSSNVDAMLKSRNLDIKRLLGVIPGNGAALGLDERWAYNVIKTVGNYGEVFERNVGMQSRIRMERGLNAPWTSGGLMYAPPLR